MRIYQYTNIEALAYILKNRTIRFNRLDRVDDVEKGNAESKGVNFVNMFSCPAGRRAKKKTFLYGKCMAVMKAV